MLPYLDPPALALGPLALDWPTIMWSCAILLYYVLYMRLAANDRRTASEFFAVTLVSSLAGGLISSQVHGGGRSSEAMAFGATGSAAYLLWHRKKGIRTALRLMNAGCEAAPLPLAILRFGCVLEHAHAGVRSDSWLAIRYPQGARWDLAVLEVIFFLAMCVLFRTVRRPWHMIVLFALYGAFRAATGTLQLNFSGSYVFPAVLVSSAAATSLVIWWSRKREGTNE